MRFAGKSGFLLALAVLGTGVSLWMLGRSFPPPEKTNDLSSRRERVEVVPDRSMTASEIRVRLEASGPLPPGSPRDEEILRLLRLLAATDPAAAIALACEYAGIHGNPDLAAELFAGWMDRDEAAALVFPGTRQADEFRDGFVQVIVSRLSSSDPERALAVAGQLPGYDGDISSLPLSGRWDESDEIDGTIREHAYAGIFREWAANDPSAAATRASGLSDPLLRNLALQEVARKWVLKEPGAAVLWATQLPAGKDRQSAVEGIIDEWTRHDPQEVAAFLERSGDVPGRDGWLRTLATNWTEGDPGKALGWAAGMSSEPDRIQAVRTVLSGISGKGSRGAAEFAATLPAGAARREGMEVVLLRWAAEDAAGLNAWVAALPHEELRREAREILSVK